MRSSILTIAVMAVLALQAVCHSKFNLQMIMNPTAVNRQNFLHGYIMGFSGVESSAISTCETRLINNNAGIVGFVQNLAEGKYTAVQAVKIVVGTFGSTTQAIVLLPTAFQTCNDNTPAIKAFNAKSMRFES